GDLQHARQDEAHVAGRLQGAIERILYDLGRDWPPARKRHAGTDLEDDRGAVAFERPGLRDASLELVGEGARQASRAVDRPHLPGHDRIVEIALDGVATHRLED